MAPELEYDEIIETNGIKVPFVSRIITPNIEQPMRNSRYEGGECASLRKVLRAGDRVLELGAGVGLISTVAALVEGVESVTAVEADPGLISLIRETHRLNGVANVDLRNGVVVSGNKKKASFYVRVDFWASSMEPGSRPFAEKKQVACLNIKELVKEINPTVIICDIEGGELGLFDDVDLTGVRAMILEFHPKVYGHENVEAITNLLEGNGLTFDIPNKPSTVRRFERQKIMAPSEKSIQGVLPTKGQAWAPEKARFFVSTCMRDEGPFILEWLAWHKSIGIQDFVVFTNDCSDGTDLLLDRLEEMGELRHLPNPALALDNTWFQPVSLAYVPYLSEFRRADFFLSIDVDEFINIRLGSGQISELLMKTGPFDVLSMSELNHGSNMKETFERGFVRDQFPRHESETPGVRRSRRGVKSIVRLSDKLKKIRNHRPDFLGRYNNINWMDGSGRRVTSLQEDSKLNGLDVRGTYDFVALDHYPLRSLDSFLVKMFRGNVVVKDVMVSQRYWRLRDRSGELTSTFKRQNSRFKKKYTELLRDKVLSQLHKDCCVAHEIKISSLLKEPVFSERKQWVKEAIWTPRVLEENPL